MNHKIYPGEIKKVTITKTRISVVGRPGVEGSVQEDAVLTAQTVQPITVGVYGDGMNPAVVTESGQPNYIAKLKLAFNVLLGKYNVSGGPSQKTIDSMTRAGEQYDLMLEALDKATADKVVKRKRESIFKVKADGGLERVLGE